MTHPLCKTAPSKERSANSDMQNDWRPESVSDGIKKCHYCHSVWDLRKTVFSTFTEICVVSQNTYFRNIGQVIGQFMQKCAKNPKWHGPFATPPPRQVSKHWQAEWFRGRECFWWAKHATTVILFEHFIGKLTTFAVFYFYRDVWFLRSLITVISVR